jgi:thioredoxin-related protein
MNQNSIFPVKILAVTFIVSFAIALILYFQTDPGKLSWLNLNEGLKKAKETNKMIFVKFYSKWDKKSKQLNESIFSNDSVVKYLNSNFLPVMISLNDNEQSKKAEELFGIKGTSLFLVLDKNGRPASFAPTQFNEDYFLQYLQEIKKINIFKWLSYEDALQETDSTGKLTFCIVTSDINVNLMFNDILKKQENLNELEMNYIPTTLYLYYKSDRNKIVELLGEKNDLLQSPFMQEYSVGASTRNGFQYSRKEQNSRVYLIGKKRNILGSFDLDEKFWERKELTPYIMKALENNNKANL